MSHPLGNRLHVGKNDATMGCHFGMPYSIHPMHHVNGQGHDEKIACLFYGGLRVEMSPATAAELVRRLPEALAHLPVTPACSGSLANVEGFDA